MSRAFGAHYWVKGEGPRGRRGVRCDRCHRCGLLRSKRNGVRAYRWPKENDSIVPPKCDPKRLQMALDLDTPAFLSQPVPKPGSYLDLIRQIEAEQRA